MMWTVYKNYLLVAFRHRYLQVMAVLVLATGILVAISGAGVHQKRLQAFTDASAKMRAAWTGQGAVNPHNSAHYGHIVFQPVTPVQVLDNGLRPYAGSMLRLEAHKQNMPAFSAAQQRTELSRFGDFSLAWVLQVMVPLLIILLAFQAISADKESQTLRLIAAQGTSALQLILGRALAVFSIAVTILLLCTGIQLLVFAGQQGLGSLPMGHLASWLLAYTFFFFAISLISVNLSAVTGSSGASFVIQLSLWALATVVLPRFTANLGSALLPAEQKLAFNAALNEDRKKGIDGHNPEDKRIKAFEDSLLARYKVKVLDSLPVNVDGLIMQADENYSNLVYDKHYNRVRQRLQKQFEVHRYAGWLNPCNAVQGLSMGYAQSDLHHHLQLLADAEAYRRELVKALNDKMAYGGSRTGDWDWAPDSTWYGTLPDFSYHPPALKQVTRWYMPEWAMLLAWTLLGGIWMYFISKKLYR
jgi:ABC-2 type transport system permease protein